MTMAMANLLRTLLLFHTRSSPSSFSLLRHLSFLPTPFTPPPTKYTFHFTTNKPFITSLSKPINTKVNFTPPDSESDSEPVPDPTHLARRDLPPPYDPFSKQPIYAEPEDPKNLQEVFHKMRSEGLFNNAVKMFDEMSKSGLTHEALELFREIKDKGRMPDVVAHTAVIEAYGNAGQSKEAHKVFLRMLACGVAPNFYTYCVLVKSLAREGKLVEVRKYVLEMLEKRMRPNGGVCVEVFEAFSREGKVEEGKKLLEELKERGFVVDEKEVREIVKGKRGPIFRTIMDILFAK